MKIIAYNNVPSDNDTDVIIANGVSKVFAKLLVDHLNSIGNGYFHEAVEDNYVLRDANDYYGFPMEKQILYIEGTIVHFKNGATVTTTELHNQEPVILEKFMESSRVCYLASYSKVY